MSLVNLQVSNTVPSFTKGEGASGAICYYRSSFLDKFLLPKLAAINDDTIVRVVDVEFKGWGSWHAAVRYGMSAEEAKAKGIDFSWKQDLAASGSDGLVFGWNYDGKAGGTNWAIEGNIYTWSSKNTLKLPVGLNEEGKAILTVSGKTELRIDSKRIIGSQTGHIHGDWMFQLVLDGSGDNGVSFDYIYDPSKPEHLNVWKTHEAGFLAGDWLEEWVSRIDTSLRKTINPERACNEIKGLLSGDKSFAFGGGDNFYIDNLRFTESGDFLAELKLRS